MDENVFLGLVFLTAAAVMVSFFLAWRIRRFQVRAARAEGRVTRFTSEQTTTWKGQGEGSETTTWHSLHVEFVLEDGSRIEFRSRFEEEHPRVSIGQRVTVLYDRSHPTTTAEIDNPIVWRPVAISGMLTVVLLLVTVFGKACGS